MPGSHRKKPVFAWRIPAAAALSVEVVAAVVWIARGGAPPAEPPANTAAAATVSAQAAPRVAVPVAGTVPAPAEPAFAGLTKAPCSTDLSGTRPHVAMAGNFLKAMFGVRNVGGAVGRAGGNDEHSIGLALDFMVSDNALGTAIANFILANQRRLGVTYVIWQQRYNAGGGWSMMENRGSATANHYDHVHVSFSPSAKTDFYC